MVQNGPHRRQFIRVVKQELAKPTLGVDEFEALRHSSGGAFDMVMKELFAGQIARLDDMDDGLLDVCTPSTCQEVMA